MLKVDFETRRIIDAVRKMSKRLQPREITMRRALTEIGILVSREAKINARRKRIIDSGRLINSIRYEFFTENNKPGILIGSFGVPYAAINEFGGPFTDRQRRAMFAALGRAGKLKKNYAPKGVIVGNRYRKRPYLIPAVRENTNRIVDILRRAALEK